MSNNNLNLRWEPYDDEDAISEDGDIVVGEEGCSDYRVIAQCVDRDMGQMIVRDVLAHDALVAGCEAARAALTLFCEHPGSADARYISPTVAHAAVRAIPLLDTALAACKEPKP